MIAEADMFAVIAFRTGPNELVDVIMKYWGYNTVRPSDFG
jgi:hypothetical protein